jgi:ABC-type transporter Mla subunit MlaD
MESKRAALKVGMFVLASIVALLALIFFLSGSVLHPGVPYETYFTESVQGLDVGTAVKFRGVTIGKITDVGLVTAEYPPPDTTTGDRKVYRQVVVRFTVDPRKLGRVDNVQRVIAQGLRVQIAPQGITGLAYLELSFVSPLQYPVQPVPWTPDSQIIPSIPSTLTQLQDAAEQVMTSLSHVDLGKMVNEISTLTATLHDEITSGDAHQAVANANTLLANLNTTVQQTNLPATSAALRNLADGPQTEQIISQLNQATAQLAKTTSQLPALVASSQAAIGQANEATADLQAQLIPILQDMKTATANLRTLSSALARNPSQVILGAPPPPDGASDGDKQ